ncbi:MAG: hypothetical protein WC208_09755 [Gallionella sp.]|jgi:hypothetical protein
MSYYIENLGYSLSKRVPAMESGFSIETNYGPISFEEDEAKSVITAVRKLLERKLKAAEKAQARRQP